MRPIETAFASILLVALVCVGAAHSQGTREPKPGTGASANLDEDSYARGDKEAPGLLKAAGVSCAVTQAARIGTGKLLDHNGKRGEDVDFYEAACAEGPGYIVTARKGTPPMAYDCIAAAQGGKVACMLPKNSHPATGLDIYLTAAGVRCSGLRARMVAEDTKLKWRAYEVQCRQGGGYILSLPLPDGTGPAPSATDCLQLPGDCTFTSHVESVAMLAHAVGKSIGADCKISDARYVGYVEAKQSDLYELSCQTGHDGLLVELDHTGAVRNSMPCASTKLSGASCQLRPSDKADPLILYAENNGAAPALFVTKADWRDRPDGAVANIYPDRAQRNGVAGQAQMGCTVDVSGKLSNCFVTDESPVGYGFGDAALKMAPKFRLKPPTENGVPVGGLRIIIPIYFQLSRAGIVIH